MLIVPSVCYWFSERANRCLYNENIAVAVSRLLHDEDLLMRRLITACMVVGLVLPGALYADVTPFGNVRYYMGVDTQNGDQRWGVNDSLVQFGVKGSHYLESGHDLSFIVEGSLQGDGVFERAGCIHTKTSTNMEFNSILVGID